MPRCLGVLAAICLLALTPRALAQVAQQSSGSRGYAVEGLALGSVFDGSAYREYKCTPSDQFDGFTWCQSTRKEKERRGPSNITHSILHARDGSVVYINRYQEPILFGPNEAERDIQSYSRKFGERPRLTRVPPGLGFGGIVASWGKTVLEPLDVENRKAFAEGKRLTKGYYVDFIGNFDRSAKDGLPLYRITGGAGFVLVASFDQRGRGSLRLAAVDASAFYPELMARSQPESQHSSAGVERTEGEMSASEKSNTRIAHQTPEQAADKASDVLREESEAAKRDAQLAKTEIERLNAEGAKLNAALERLETEKTAAEAKAHTMESAAYGGIGISMLLLAIVSYVIFVNHRKVTAAKREGVEPGTKPSEAIEDSTGVAQRKSEGSDLQPLKVSDTASSSPAAQSLSSDATAPKPQGGSDASDVTSRSDIDEERVTLPI